MVDILPVRLLKCCPDQGTVERSCCCVVSAMIDDHDSLCLARHNVLTEDSGKGAATRKFLKLYPISEYLRLPFAVSTHRSDGTVSAQGPSALPVKGLRARLCVDKFRRN